jgi:hypothetical protein
MVASNTARSLARCLARAGIFPGTMEVPDVDDDELRAVTSELAALIPPPIARRLRAVPLGFSHEDPPRLRVAMRDPGDAMVVAQLSSLTGYPVVPLRAWNVQMALALDRLYPTVADAPPRRVPEGTRPPPRPEPASDDWKKTKIPDDVPDGMLHDNSVGRTLLIGLLIGVVIAGAMVAGFVLRERAREDSRDSYQGDRVSGRTAAEGVGLSIDFSGGYWRHSDSNDHGDLFVRIGGGGAIYGELLVWRETDEIPETTEEMERILDLATYTKERTALTRCDESTLHDPPAMECSDEGRGDHYWAWVEEDGAGVIIVRYYTETGGYDAEQIERIVRSIRPL